MFSVWAITKSFLWILVGLALLINYKRVTRVIRKSNRAQGIIVPERYAQFIVIVFALALVYEGILTFEKWHNPSLEANKVEKSITSSKSIESSSEKEEKRLIEAFAGLGFIIAGVLGFISIRKILVLQKILGNKYGFIVPDWVRLFMSVFTLLFIISFGLSLLFQW